MDAFELSDLRLRRQAQGVRYLEFLRGPTLSLGLYGLRAGEPDPQQPHTEDEVYVVTRGRATLRVGDAVHEVRAGSVVRVEAGMRHRFESVTEDLETLVLFAPAEGTAGVGEVS